MTATIVVACPECEKQMKAPAELRGKKVKCKACGHSFTVSGSAAPPSPAARTPAAQKPATGKPGPSAAPAKTKAAPPPAKKVDEEEGGAYGFADPDAQPTVESAPKAPPPKPKPVTDEANPYGVTELNLTARCPHCAGEMESEEATICLNCGYNTMTRQEGHIVKTIAHTGFEKFLWLLPGILAAMVVLFMAFTIAWLWLWMHGAAEKDKEAWWTFLDAFPTQVWGSVIAAGLGWTALRYAFKRLVLHPSPPEKIKQ